MTELQTRQLTLPEGDVTLKGGLVLKKIEEKVPGRWIKYKARNNMTVIASLDRTLNFGELLRISIAFPSRNPGWEEMNNVLKAFVPDDIDMMMVRPRKSDYVNVHPYCFQWFQCPERWGIKAW